MKFNISARFYFLIALFATGAVILASSLIWLQNQKSFAARQESLEQLVDTAIGVLDAHKKMADQGKLKEEEAKQLALSVIGNLRYNGTDYFFGRTLDGITILNPAAPQTVGRRRDDVQDSKGKYYVREMTAITQNAGRGFVDYTFPKPGTGVETDKTSFLKVYKPWGIAIGTGVYMDDLQAVQRATMWQATYITLAILLVMGLITFFIVNGVVKPLARVTQAMREVMQGRSVDVAADSARGDEIGEIARTIVVFGETATARARTEQEAFEQRAEAERDRSAREAEKADEAERARVTMSTLGEGLNRLAHGDLLCEIRTPFEGRSEQLRADFNATVEKLREAMQAVVVSTQSIASGALEISTATDDLSRRTEQQAASLEQTAAALDEITATVKKAAEGASHARDIVSTAKSDAETGGVVVRKAVDAMSSIERSSEQISQIISVIDEIAFQTNLLALNAGVEAARAGEAGRGFAVVASEVRALAQRSADAAKQIKSIITASAQQVADGVKLVGETGASLERIMAQVNDINSSISAIASGAQEQATGLMQINTAINHMDQATQQNAAMVEETTAASTTLSQEAGNLSTLVGQFKVGEQQHAGNVVPRRAARPAASAPRAQPPKPRLVSATPRKGAAAAAVAPSEDNWKDF